MTKKHRSKKMSCDDDQYPKLFLYYCQGVLIETKKDTKSIKLLSFKFIRFLYACNICNVIRLPFTTNFTHVLIYIYVYIYGITLQILQAYRNLMNLKLSNLILLVSFLVSIKAP